MRINEKNIEALLFDYAEGGLSKQDKEAVEAFLRKNPQYAALLQNYDGNETLKEPTELVFTDKEDLFRLATESRPRKAVLTFPNMAWICSAAAALLLLVVLLPLFDQDQKLQQAADTALAKTCPQKSAEKNAVEKELVAETKNESPKEKIKTPKEKNESAIHSTESAFPKIDVPQVAEELAESRSGLTEETPSEALPTQSETVPQVQITEKVVINETRREYYAYEQVSFKTLIKEYVPVEQTIAKATESVVNKGVKVLGKIGGLLSKMQVKEACQTYAQAKQRADIKS